MSTGEDIYEQLSAYLDGELNDEQVRRVEQALRDDPHLAGELEALRATRDAVRNLPRAKAPEDFAASVMDQAERLRLRARAPAARKRLIHWASVATAAVVLVAVGIGVVVTVHVTMAPSWTDKLARQGGTSRLALAPAKQADESGRAKEQRGVAEEKVAERRLAAAADKGEADRLVSEREAGSSLNVIRGTHGISPGLAAGAERPGDQIGVTNVPTYKVARADRGTGAVAGVPATARARGVDQIGMMPAIAAAPGPPGDGPAGVVTQVGGPYYTGRQLGEQTPTTAGAQPVGEYVHPRSVAGRPEGLTEGAIKTEWAPTERRQFSAGRWLLRWLEVPATSRPVSMGGRMAATAPSTQPASAPQPTSAPATGTE